MRGKLSCWPWRPRCAIVRSEGERICAAGEILAGGTCFALRLYCPAADEQQLDEAIAAAKAAFLTWSALSEAKRREHLLRLTDAIEVQAEDFAHLLTAEQGKPLDFARGDVAGACAMLRATAALEIAPRTISETPEMRNLEKRRPLGVAAAIIPWNMPLLILEMKIGPALLAGNMLICKPAPPPPLSAALLGELCADIFPAGVINIVFDRNDLGAYLTSHPDIAKISFTGSTATGKKVLQSRAL